MVAGPSHADDGVESKIEPLYPAGNVPVVCKNGPPDTWRTWLVSSHILSIVSPKFAALFRFMVRENHQELISPSSCLSLNGEDPLLLGLLFEVLHFREPQKDVQMNLKKIAQLAILCDKYSCCSALRPWSSHWLGHAPAPETPEEYGYALLASHLYENEPYFATVSANAVRNLRLDSASAWSDDEILRYLPRAVHGRSASPSVRGPANGGLDDLKMKLTAAMDHLRCHVDYVVDFHQRFENVYLLGGLMCLICGRTHPDSARGCHACRNQDLYAKICTPAYRIGEYLIALKAAALWPPSEVSRTCSVMEFAARVASVKSSLQHRCGAGKLCPLELGVELLNTKVQRTIASIMGCMLDGPSRDESDDTA
jgi:hypothetical protein